VNLSGQPLPTKTRHTVIIDTGCGNGDLIALGLFLARPEITIKAVLVSDKELYERDCVAKITSLLNTFGRSNIPVTTDQELKGAECISKVLEGEVEKITIVCMGTLTSVARALGNDSRLSSKIERIMWYNESVKPISGFNYERDKESADMVLRSGIRLDVISDLARKGVISNASMISVCNQSETELAHVLAPLFRNDNEKNVISPFRSGLLALYVTNPELFSINADVERLNIRYNLDYDVPGINEAIADMIKGSYVTERNIVFNRFPVQRELYNYDVRHIIDTAIARYGNIEWKAVAMTDEFHGHLGVFSIVGAKMGIRAREIFGVGPDLLTVVSDAGDKPPYSCLNDGLQVSTGATLGMGTISLSKINKAGPSAVFTYKDRSVRITLKKEYLLKVEADIREGIIKYGLTDDAYWKLIRSNAIKYWVDWDRNNIFEIEEISRVK
jgi:inosine-uridine nucleoside N-ribohydrolase/formylmethanofuran dehydrogenase subunit E